MILHLKAQEVESAATTEIQPSIQLLEFLADFGALDHQSYELIEYHSRYTPATLVAASISAIALVITLTLLPVGQSEKTGNPEAFEIMTSNEPLKMYENLEFYLFLEKELKV